jgi:hypothetical protein
MRLYYYRGSQEEKIWRRYMKRTFDVNEIYLIAASGENDYLSVGIGGQSQNLSLTDK